MSMHVRGWTRGSEGLKLRPHVFDEAVHCAVCKGWGLVWNDEVNRRRKHFMQRVICAACGGSGNKQEGQDHATASG